MCKICNNQQKINSKIQPTEDILRITYKNAVINLQFFVG